MNEEKFRHGSYGNLNIYRSTGEKRTLFGSDLKQGNTINLEISLSELTRGINNDWYYPYEKLIQIEMSPVQFAEAITNMNTNGVPCTIKMFDGKRIDECPEVNKGEIFKKEFTQTLNGTTSIAKNLVKEVAEKFKKKTLNKSDKEEIMSMLNKIYQNLGSNLDYMVDCCKKQVDKTVVEGKSEVEAYIMNRVNTLGLKALEKESNNIVELDK